MVETFSSAQEAVLWYEAQPPSGPSKSAVTAVSPSEFQRRIVTAGAAAAPTNEKSLDFSDYSSQSHGHSSPNLQLNCKTTASLIRASADQLTTETGWRNAAGC